ncbi:MAG: HAD family phosphatase [Bacilli bacterium]|nr:HAD family phosphatase [Bacilli bacterium]
MYRLVVSSFDKTLIDDDFAIPISTVLTIDFIRRQGSKFVVATNRGVSFIQEYVKDVNFVDYIVSLNGSYVYDVMKEKVIYERKISKDIIRKIVSKYKKEEYIIYLCTDHSKCILSKEIINRDDVIIRNLEDFLKNNKVYKIEIHTKNIKICKSIMKELENMVVHINIGEYEKGDCLVEITSKNITKSIAVEKICLLEKIDMKDVMFIGNSFNDIELIKQVGFSVCMQNAPSEVRKISMKHTFSNNEKGVERVIRNVFEVN